MKESAHSKRRPRDRADDRAVSPVVGVVLMVGITVTLASVTGVFLLDIGEDRRTVPQASFDFEYDGSDLVITHTGGNTFTTANTDRLTVVFGATKTTWGGGPYTSVTPVEAGNSYTVSPAPGDTVRVVWTSPDRAEVHILVRFDVPA